jgi:sigma-B regulation protein RsbU (phosphoserine phosphatase)
MFKMKTKIILLLCTVVFVSSAILLFMVIKTFKKDKVSYVYESITSQTQAYARQLQNEIESLELLATTLSNKKSEDSQEQDASELKILKSIALVKEISNTVEIVNQFSQKAYTQNANYQELIYSELHKINTIDQKKFISDSNLVYQIIVNQIVPEKLATIIVFDSETMNELNENTKDNQFAFVMDDTFKIIAGPKKQLNSFSQFMSSLDAKTLADSQSGQFFSNENEQWIYSISSLPGINLKIFNLVSEKKAFSVLKVIYFKSFVSYVLIFSIVVIIGIISATYLTDRLNHLTTATRKVTEGQLDTEIVIGGQDEIASMSRDFNQMVKQIKKLLGETAEQARMENELKTAQLVQENLFPAESITYSNCIITGYCKPATECGGDWWFHSEDDQFVNIIIADATGHGVPAALMTSAIKSAFIITAKLKLSASETISKINEALCEVGRNKVMMTAFYIRIDKKTDSAEYINASHEAPFILDMNSEVIEKGSLIFLNEHSSARLGQSTDTVYKSSPIQLQKKQRLFLYTDGIFDLKNDDHKKLTERQFYKKVIEIANVKTVFSVYADDIKKFIFDYHTQKTLDDDVTLCHIEVI